MLDISHPVVALVILVALVGAFVAIAVRVFPKLQGWLQSLAKKGAAGAGGDPGKGGTAPPPGAAAPSAGDKGDKGDKNPKDCPDGTGRCPSDDTPPVDPPVPWPAACRPWPPGPTAQKFADYNNKVALQTCIPIGGAIWSGVDQLRGHGSPIGPISDAVAWAAADLKEAGEQWENSYVRFLGTLAKDILPVVQDVFGKDAKHGFVGITAEHAALPLTQAVQLMIAPIAALLICSVILVWAA